MLESWHKVFVEGHKRMYEAYKSIDVSAVLTMLCLKCYILKEM